MTKKFKIILITILVSVVAILAIAILPSALKNTRSQTGMEWFEQQKTYIDYFEQYAETMDLIYESYLYGQTSEAAFLSDLDVLESELRLLKSDYQKYLNENPVKEGTQNYYMEQGCQSIYDSFDILLSLLSDSRGSSNDKNQLLYTYIAYEDELTSKISGYQAAAILIYGADEMITYQEE